MVSIGQYAKFIIAVLGAASVSITTFAGTAAWAPTALSIISAILVYLVPNAPKTVAPPVQPVPPVGPHTSDGGNVPRGV